MSKISVIISCYNEEKAIPLFYEEIEKNIKDFENTEFEYIFINDGSTDNTLSVIKDLKNKDNKVKYVSFSRNFGKEAAIYAGLEHATGDYVTLMDADLQDPPFLLKDMYKAVIEEGYDAVGTRRVTRKGEPVIRSFFARIFYKLINKMSKIEMVDGARDYVLMSRQVVNSILSLKEYNRYSKGLFSFVGFKVKWIEFENVQRVAGETKWSFWKLFMYALEGITAFSTKPLIFSSFIGLLFCLLAFLLILLIIVRTLCFGDPTSGWPSLVCIIFMVSGIQLFSLGIIGQYLSKTYLEVKRRPIYIVKEENMD
ncbi:MAG: glycosyltransferase family 2 protein [Clostridia bacterium]|nr:glycosyltransferase family 2 protein [Clostridia bacterium]